MTLVFFLVTILICHTKNIRIMCSKNLKFKHGNKRKFRREIDFLVILPNQIPYNFLVINIKRNFVLYNFLVLLTINIK
ncbi:hypothetical protein GLOIN_2v1523426 [Rhizophagus irregularis DAOM 181602=DAOM 197198]|uniref:Secreted protein n=1 Tax=Rhizophagus irregularis (strain DAOM 181602 / DAOM 197198 / MUCL 43194) TaxID=747089 RepID=A0A2P4QQA2_RHIID|nr:hypothetical protein GLOIN_2v1523426 [Rhizophagus irregularis DAOM 181602=DAOM 197198]POG79810.1 hypothetical protein GLOIN_2v1523426 [Rhizophagus irregularis DAOM 181602=DAOM 197198]GET60881.1 hypothetical protein GLOIN_2v1523426 [Rhizophagus irregularis DAOM 181602=DAOM 197198]|eukprot:XP_025186676.1 hypothetical protein GLOIN_2v1523426 [Rhizophagus irregularis DAOM 181602=DAOM 197198]